MAGLAAPAPQAPAPILPAELVAVPSKKSHGARNVIVVVAIAILIILAGSFGTGFLGGIVGGSVNTSQRDTWQQWGMSIQYPSGLNAQYSPSLQTQATSSSGGVSWAWNNGQTQLGLGWVTTPTYSPAAALQAYYPRLQSHGYTNIQLLGQGNMTMAGHSWVYGSYSWQYQGMSQYSTFAVTYYSASTRGYALIYQDSSPGTQTALETYGNTFSG